MRSADGRIETTTPSIPQFLLTWQLDPVTLVTIAVAGVLYALGLLALRRAGIPWPAWRGGAGYLLGRGTDAGGNLGCLGVWQPELR